MVLNTSMCKSTILEKENILAQALVFVRIDVKEDSSGFHVKAEISFLSQRI